MGKVDINFFQRDVLEVAPELLGKKIIRKDGTNLSRYLITEVEAYRGEEDLACHASKGRTRRTEIMYGIGGHIYVYLIYGMYWMLNFVTAEKNIPQAVLIRGIESAAGPGKLSRKMGIDKTYYGESLIESKRIWVEESAEATKYISTPRIGIDYAREPWKSMPWRFIKI